MDKLPLWSNGQSSWLHIHRSRVRFLALPDFFRSSGSGTGSTQPCEYNWGATWKKSSGSGLENREYDRGDSLRRPRNTLCPQKLAVTSLTSGIRSVGIVRSRTKATELLEENGWKWSALQSHCFASRGQINVGKPKLWLFLIYTTCEKSWCNRCYARWKRIKIKIITFKVCGK
jgi:hypothetical protein